MTITRGLQRELIQGASSTIQVFGHHSPLSLLFHVVVWGTRKVISLTRLIKKIFYTTNHPCAYIAGHLLEPLAKFFPAIKVAARVVTIIRPFFDASEAGFHFSKSANGVVDSVNRNRGVARFYQKLRKTSGRCATSRIGFFFNDYLPLFLKRLGKAIGRAAVFSAYICDLSEACSASKEDTIERSIAELQLIVNEVGIEKIFRTLDFQEKWVNKILCRLDPSLKLPDLKEAVTKVHKLYQKIT